MPPLSQVRVMEVGPSRWRWWRRARLEALAEAPGAFGSTLADWTGAGHTEERWRSRFDAVELNALLVDGSEDVADDATGAEGPEALGMVGALIIAHADGPCVDLISLWVRPSARRQGVGEAAVAYVVDWARREHPELPLMLSVKLSNEPARTLYRRLGFVEAGPDPDDPMEIRMRHLAGGADRADLVAPAHHEVERQRPRRASPVVGPPTDDAPQPGDFDGDGPFSRSRFR